jgi:hypothetical protein
VVDLALELQKIYDSEINVRIRWFWDAGITVELGDELSGFVAEETVALVTEIVPWLQEAIAHFYPTSAYAASLAPEIRDRAARQLFHPPRIGASVNCPHCGAPNAAGTMFHELIAFVCARCGAAVEVKLPKVH